MIGLIRVEGQRAIVTGISDTISCGSLAVLLPFVGHIGAVVVLVQDPFSVDVIVTFVSETVIIRVPLCEIDHGNAIVARISEPVTVLIRLVVFHVVAVVAHVPIGVAVRVPLQGIEHIFTVVLLVGDTVTIDIGLVDAGILILVRVGQWGAIVTRIADAIHIPVLLKVIVRVGAVVAGIPDAVWQRRFAVFLVRIAHEDAVVCEVRHPVTVVIILCQRETDMGK
jgi:hypothetical protein